MEKVHHSIFMPLFLYFVPFSLCPYGHSLQLSHHFNFFIGSIETTEIKVADVEKELIEVEIQAFEVERISRTEGAC